MAKIIALQLRSIVSKIISPNQGAFEKGRWIVKNMFIAQEVIHTIWNHKGKKGLMAMKIDLRKAYNKIEWKFVDQALEGWGFGAKFRELILSCISTVYFSGHVAGSFSLGMWLVASPWAADSDKAILSPLLVILTLNICLKCSRKWRPREP